MSTKLSLNPDLSAVSPINPALHPEVATDMPQLLCDFLEWAQQEKGFVLCEAYKPKYDWYTPIHYHSRILVEKFLDGGVHAQSAPPHDFSKSIQPALESALRP